MVYDANCRFVNGNGPCFHVFGISPSALPECKAVRVLNSECLSYKAADFEGSSGVKYDVENSVLAGWLFLSLPQRDAELFVCVEIQDAGAEALVRAASSIERDWLPPEFFRHETRIEFDEAQERLIARRRVLWQDLVFEESPAPILDDEAAAAILAPRAYERFESAFPRDDADVAGFVERVRSLRQWLPELDLPPLEDDQLRELLPVLCFGRRSLAEVRRAPWLASIEALYTWDQLQSIEREAPARLRLPSGRMAPLEYQAGKPPILAARVQELFGWRETPRIARGRIAVLLHILAPNYRVQQVTDDLASFWRNTYPQVRKDVRGRYPKHAWPENPHTPVEQKTRDFSRGFSRITGTNFICFLRAAVTQISARLRSRFVDRRHHVQSPA
jgi:HrpA-like RNA helicase